MSATSIRYVTSIPAGGLKFEGSPRVEINTITPLGEGNLVIKPSTPIDGRLTETIPIGVSMIGSSIPGAGALLIDETTTSLPLVVVLAAPDSQPYHIMVPGSSGGGGGGGDASAANQLAQIARLSEIIANTTGAAKDVTVGQVVQAIVDLGAGATIADIVVLLSTDALTQADILAKLTEIGVDVDASAASLVTLVTQTDQLEPLLAELVRFQAPPKRWKKYAAIPPGGLDLTTVYPGFVATRIETYGDGVLITKPLGDPAAPVSLDTFYGWTWNLSAATIEDTTTGLPLVVYWS